ncbi:MAG TPA: dNTP triphosphohydrolase [Bryobacteraceae bacterium]|nr:dNTP triphosphohydrolase [Bryobacteraceae bacterium]
MAAQPLAYLRFPVARSRGRRYPEFPHPYRNDFQRDRDRIIHARAFRRLEDKTQVFPPGVSDHFRNRLTHTIEVSQIAGTAAAYLGLDEDLTEALALAHDIGHPPFGHAGEQELHRQMLRFGDRFEHNLHALRIVEIFEERYALFPGLNLTFELREGIVKHSGDLSPGIDPALDEYLPHLRPPLEAQLIDLADEIAYNTADLDDAHSAQLIGTRELAASVPAFARVFETIEMQYPGAPDRIQFLECVRRLIDILVSSLIEGTLQAATASRARDVDEVREHSVRLAEFTPEGQAVNASLKAYLHKHVYAAEELQAARQSSTAAIRRLFDDFLENPDQLPEIHRQKIATSPLHRVICDYIAGMTDGFFWKKLG